MTYWMVSLITLASLTLGIGDLTQDRIQDRDPILQQDQLKDGSCQTVSVVTTAVVQVNA